jgi:exopolysaccharide production protein ExoQ
VGRLIQTIVFAKQTGAPLTSKLHRFYVLIPTIGCFFAVVVSPAMLLGLPDEAAQDPARVENRIFWFSLTALCLALSAQFRPVTRLYLPRNLIWLTLYLVLAGLSISWAIAIDASFRRYVQQVMVVVCVVLPIILTRQREIVINDLFVCFALAACINLPFLAISPGTEFGHPGMYTNKNLLGLVAALAFIFALHETCRKGFARRVRGGAVLGIAMLLLLASESKTSLGLALLAPSLAGFVIATALLLGISPFSFIGYFCALSAALLVVFSDMFSFGRDDALTLLFGDPTLTGRTTIWAFASDMIERRPLLGWGYQSFWLVGPEAPSVREAPGFVALMPHAHNGYLDTVLQTGFVGLALLGLMIFSSTHAVGRLVNEQPRRAWLALSLLLFTVLYNGLESTFVRSFDISWLVFLIVCADVGIAGRVSSEFLTPDKDPTPGDPHLRNGGQFVV